MNETVKWKKINKKQMSTQFTGQNTTNVNEIIVRIQYNNYIK